MGKREEEKTDLTGKQPNMTNQLLKNGNEHRGLLTRGGGGRGEVDRS